MWIGEFVEAYHSGWKKIHEADAKVAHEHDAIAGM
jgi:hypothetical protein